MNAILAINQYGDKVILDPKRPRADLMEQYYTKHADKIYVDSKDGKTKHIGYIVSGLWFEFYTLADWEGSK